ncbi:DUF3857 domain-containing protein [Algoriphagus aquimarinus]|uniref:Transglutaminase-like superfamily protein n=1 Tax=Algoriphagus aquimarinus TaxID=237018 RepID=A0A1I1AJE7_9BACT|nr:DUF3857 domain-containing protein [Algoriphagus aquimarinus]SFB38047.1 Transglutaminase-like superfamily protein [Algoriphagus aquimarinus]
MLRILLVGMLLCVVTSSVHAQKIKISPIPQWVETPNLDLNKKRETQIGEGFRYLLFEKQINIQERESFHRYSVQVLSVDGIQEYSDVQIEYDPSFQKLEVHEVSIYRDGKKINKLNSDDFKLIQKESSADRYIYDGALNALLHLSDVQKNDIIDYSYSLKGFNPVYGKQYSGFLYHQFYAKVEKFHYRVLLSQGQPLGIHTNGNLFKPSKLTQSGLDIYQWDHDGLQAMSFDNNVPYWSAMYPMTSISTFSDWKSVVDWALPLYKYSEEGLDVIKKQLPEKNQNNARITDIIRYVQDDIRYLGLESGMSAYLPNSPQKVFKQKYGDCKDKSLLLVALLRSEGLEAYPVLVNTEWKNNIDAFTANANAFDHCVVTYKWKDKDYYVDPTISDQGGNLTGIYFPDYSRGLVLKAGNSELISFSEPIKSSQKVEELIIVKDLEGSASMKIKTEYRGKKADEIRSSFANSTIDEISKNYLNFYSGVYPDIEASAAIEYSDSDRNISNIVTTVENYDIKNFWQKADDDSQLIGEVYPLDLQTKLNFPQTASREMDYFLGNPEVFLLTTKIVMPEYWPVQSYHNKIDGGAFTYENEIKGEGNVIDISHKYELIKASIPGSEVSNLLDKKNLALDNLNFYLTYNPAGAGRSLSFLSVFICVLVLAISFYFGKKLYEGFNPAPQDISFYKGIGGWLVLPAISLIAVPVTIIFSLIDGEYFNSAVWTNIGVYGAGFKVYYGVTFVFLIFLFCFAILTAIFFFKLRTGAPQLFILLISINFVSLILEAYVGDQYFPELELDSSAKDIIRSVLGLFIWIPYFIKSERVKSTFTRTYISNKVDLVIADRITEEDASQKNYSE